METREPPPILYTRPGTSAAARGDCRRDSIVHEREIPCLFAVAEQPDWLALDGRAQKSVKSHVGALPRSVDREVAQRHRRDAVIHEVQVAELFGRELRHAVGRHRLRPGVLAHRYRHAVAVDGGARRVDDPLERPPASTAASSKTCVASMLLTV